MPLIDQLKIPTNGHIYSMGRSLTQRCVAAAFTAAVGGNKGRRPQKPIVRQKRPNYIASFICFPKTATPAFLPGTNLEEKTYGFLLLLEVKVQNQWFLGVFKHGTASFSTWLDQRSKPLPRSKLTNAFSQGAVVSKMSLRRMTVSKIELRSASYEAADLQASLPMMSAPRCAIRSIRFQSELIGSIGITVGTSRVQISGNSSGTDGLASMVRQVAERTLANTQHDFLATFAQEIPIDELPQGVAPTGLLFNWNLLMESDILQIYRKTELDEECDKKLLLRYFGKNFTVSTEGDYWKFGPPNGIFCKKPKIFSIQSLLNNLLVVKNCETNEISSLSKWVRDNQNYSITFTDPNYFFGGGALYRRTGFASEAKMVLNCLHPKIALNHTTSEKGDPQAQETRFQPQSVFRVVEDSIYANAQYLCCTDLFDEWADYLCIENESLIFIHCKHGTTTSGASSFHEVVGQALKNLGRIKSTPTEFNSKIDWYQNNQLWPETQIMRLRCPVQNWQGFRTGMIEHFSNSNTTTEVHLVVTMLSLSIFETEMARNTPRPYFIQLVWLLASFINSCREMGAKPILICKP